jgi:hypothetical protein
MELGCDFLYLSPACELWGVLKTHGSKKSGTQALRPAKQKRQRRYQ